MFVRILSTYFLIPFLSVVHSVLFVCTIATIIVHAYYGLHASYAKNQSPSYMDAYYVKPYCRILPYLMGIYLYTLYKESKEKDEETLLSKFNNIISKGGKYVMYIMGILIIYFSLTTIHYFDQSKDWSQGIATFHELFYRPSFCLGIIFLIYPTLIGCGEFMNCLFGHPIYSPLAKLTYGIYMFHMIILYWILLYATQGHYITEINIWFNFCTALFVSLGIAFCCAILMESPTIQLSRLLLRNTNEKSEKSEKPEESEFEISCDQADDMNKNLLKDN